MEENRRSQYACHISGLNEKVVRNHRLPSARCHIHDGGPPSQLRVFRLVGLGLPAPGKQTAVCTLTLEDEGSHPTRLPGI